MAERRKVSDEAAPTKRRSVAAQPEERNYFARNDKGLNFVTTGCRLLDNVAGGGYVLGRIVNLVGDKSSGKTLLAIEASANFHRIYPDGIIRYVEAEAAFDEQYAEALGMPVDHVKFDPEVNTVEQLFEDMRKTLKSLNGRPCLYVVDSLDALSDEAEQKRGIDEGTYGGNKPKKLGELFRRLVQEVERSRMLIMIISQIRDKLNVTFGETKTRSGGRALDFYASQVIWLAEIEKMKRTVDKVDRVVGIRVKANCKKNKIGLPFRQCEFPLLFGYGMDDLTANVEWLVSVNRSERLKELGLSEAGYKVRINALRNRGGEEVTKLRDQLSRVVDEEWYRIENSFLPKARKY